MTKPSKWKKGEVRSKSYFSFKYLLSENMHDNNKRERCIIQGSSHYFSEYRKETS